LLFQFYVVQILRVIWKTHLQLTFAIMNAFETIAALTALAGVYLTTRKLSLGWFLGLLGAVLYAWLFFEHKLYAEGSLQIVYALLGLRGWLLWKNQANANETPIQRLSRTNFMIGLVATAVLTVLVGIVLQRYSDSDVPWLDAFLAAAGLTITFWMMQRYLENWLFWIGIDLLSAMLYFNRGLHVSGVLYLIFMLTAVYGYLHWKKTLVTLD
jgi:nicotinamide mononucleotide transporter